jgi:tetratricopeptide (TPR) repeat protein
LQSQQNNHPAAIAVLRRGINYHPNDPMIHFLLGQELESSGTFEEAISEYQISLKIGDGQPIEALRNIGTIYFQKLINDKKAKEYYKKYVKAGGNKNEIADAMKKLDKI